MGTPAERSSQNTQYFTRGDQIPGLVIGSWSCVGPCRSVADTLQGQCHGHPCCQAGDRLGQGVDSVGQGPARPRACHLPIRWSLVSRVDVAACTACDFFRDPGLGLLRLRCLLITLSSMSDPGTTYRTREEIQQVRSERDVIAGLKKNILEWNVTDEDSLKVGPEPGSVAPSSEHADRVCRPSTRPPRRRSTPRSPRPSRAPCPTSRSSGPTST
jgi:hypothetical protein